MTDVDIRRETRRQNARVIRNSPLWRGRADVRRVFRRAEAEEAADEV